ncbi:hypothetical protein FPRO05_08580 [Fusarium proliferatum]|uniref:F-box domain-containing protein n=1 Tax=Gibberella intermedia TaxID=948311 RepID=A0A365NH63_GIBIN|nr:hypothetical protein FPRO05_08580 [Fusarium proliferatum]
MDTNSDDEVILKLTCDYDADSCKVIDHIIPARLSRVHPERSESGFGLLGTLPAELLLITLENLDFQSLPRLSRTCLRAKRVVENLVPYQQVLKHAPTVPTALITAGLVGHYPSSAVYRTLRTDRCVSCTDFGGFLYLPTCERVCFECLHRNRGLWMITIPMAKTYFSLTYKQVQTLPIMRIIPGTYCLRTLEKTHKKPFRLVSVKAAKSLAIEVHGSAENLAALFLRLTRQGRQPNHVFERYHKAPLEAPGCDMSTLPPQIPHIGSDPFAGVSSLRAPYITDTGADWGQLCKGCQITEIRATYVCFNNEIAFAAWDVDSCGPLLWSTEDTQEFEQRGGS